MAFKSKLEFTSGQRDNRGIRIGAHAGTESYHFDHNKRQPTYGNEAYRLISAATANDGVMNFDAKLYEFQDWCPVFEIGKTPNGGTIHFASITSHVNLLHEYIVLLNTLYEMTENDIIEINIDSPGGYITTATQICTAMRQCKGQVMTHASGLCASAGSLIWSCGQFVSIGDSANFMWHMSSHYDYGNSLGIKQEAEFQINYVRDALLNISLERGFITEEEIARICDNPDDAVWISAEEMRRRVAEFEKDRSGDQNQVQV